MTQQKIIIYVKGGIVHSIHSTDPDLKVIMFDDDNISAGDQAPISRKDMEEVQQKATENCAAEIKHGNFYQIY